MLAMDSIEINILLYIFALCVATLRFCANSQKTKWRKWRRRGKNVGIQFKETSIVVGYKKRKAPYRRMFGSVINNLQYIVLVECLLLTLVIYKWRNPIWCYCFQVTARNFARYAYNIMKAFLFSLSHDTPPPPLQIIPFRPTRQCHPKYDNKRFPCAR